MICRSFRSPSERRSRGCRSVTVRSTSPSRGFRGRSFASLRMTENNITAVFGKHDEKTLAQLRDVGSRAEQVALMADGHVGYVMPIGGVAAYDNKASVVGVGFDIACGNAAIRTNLNID